MSDFLPLFPLKMVVFPGEQVKLHIFEPRYKQLINECDQNGTTFGLPAYLEDKVLDYGTEIRLLSIEKKYENGEMDIKTQGIGIFKINEFYRVAPNKLYAGADIERIMDVDNGEKALYPKIIKKVKTLFRILRIKKTLPEDLEKFYTFQIAHHVGFSLQQEYEFLCIAAENERQNYMLKHLTKLIPIVREMEKLRIKVQMNGHFKNVLPPKI